MIQFTENEIKEIISRRMKMANQFMREGYTMREGMELADGIIAEGYDANAQDVTKAIMSYIASFSKQNTPAPVDMFETIAEEKSAPLSYSATDLYRMWCENNDSVATDAELGHFTGLTPQAFSYARRELVKNGWKIDRNNGSGWLIISRPIIQEEKKYTESEMMAKFAEFIKLYK